MKIGYIHLDYGEWTVGTYNSQEIGLGKAFTSLGHEFIIVYWVSKDDKRCNTSVTIDNNLKKVYLPYKWRVVHHVMPDFKKLLSFNFNLIHLQCDNLLCVPNAVNFCIKNRIKYYCYVGTLKSSSKKRISRWIVDSITARNYASYKKSKVFGKTLQIVNALKEKGVASAEFAPVGLDTNIIPIDLRDKEFIKEELGIPADKKIIFCVCTLRHDKHPLDLLDVAEMLDDNYYIVHVGAAWTAEKEYKERLKDNKRLEKVHYLGVIPNKEVHTYYKIADYVVNFNPNEIFGMAILEAMYHDCTVVARHAPGPDCIIENNVSGFLCNSVIEMADKIKKGVKASSAHKRIIEQFRWESTAKKFLEVIENNE